MFTPTSSAMPPKPFGRTIQLFLVDGDPSGLRIASLHGWTGSVVVATQSTFGALLDRPEAARSGIYLLSGPDPDNALQTRCYIGEAENVRERVKISADEHPFWETAVIVTTSDEALTKGHIRYLEARLIQIANTVARVKLDNTQMPNARLPEADQANMEAFLSNIGVVLPVIGLDLLKPQPRAVTSGTTVSTGTMITGVDAGETRFEIRHTSQIKATAVEQQGEFVVVEGSQARKDTGHTGLNGYLELKNNLISVGILIPETDKPYFVFAKSYAFKSPSAASAVVLDRSSNGRKEWKVVGSDLTYAEWQEANSAPLS